MRFPGQWCLMMVALLLPERLVAGGPFPLPAGSVSTGDQSSPPPHRTGSSSGKSFSALASLGADIRNEEPLSLEGPPLAGGHNTDIRYLWGITAPHRVAGGHTRWDVVATDGEGRPVELRSSHGWKVTAGNASWTEQTGLTVTASSLLFPVPTGILLTTVPSRRAEALALARDLHRGGWIIEVDGNGSSVPPSVFPWVTVSLGNTAPISPAPWRVVVDRSSGPPRLAVEEKASQGRLLMLTLPPGVALSRAVSQALEPFRHPIQVDIPAILPEGIRVVMEVGDRSDTLEDGDTDSSLSASLASSVDPLHRLALAAWMAWLGMVPAAWRRIQRERGAR